MAQSIENLVGLSSLGSSLWTALFKIPAFHDNKTYVYFCPDVTWQTNCVTVWLRSAEFSMSNSQFTYQVSFEDPGVYHCAIFKSGDLNLKVSWRSREFHACVASKSDTFWSLILYLLHVSFLHKAGNTITMLTVAWWEHKIFLIKKRKIKEANVVRFTKLLKAIFLYLFLILKKVLRIKLSVCCTFLHQQLERKTALLENSRKAGKTEKWRIGMKRN